MKYFHMFYYKSKSGHINEMAFREEFFNKMKSFTFNRKKGTKVFEKKSLPNNTGGQLIFPNTCICMLRKIEFRFLMTYLMNSMLAA